MKKFGSGKLYVDQVSYTPFYYENKLIQFQLNSTMLKINRLHFF